VSKGPLPKNPVVQIKLFDGYGHRLVAEFPTEDHKIATATIIIVQRYNAEHDVMEDQAYQCAATSPGVRHYTAVTHVKVAI
jgi:hypothetical protein